MDPNDRSNQATNQVDTARPVQPTDTEWRPAPGEFPFTEALAPGGPIDVLLLQRSIRW